MIPPKARRGVEIGCLLLLLFMFCREAVVQYYLVNSDLGASDQSAYMDLSKKFAEGNSQMVPRNRMPLYPWLMSFVYERDQPARVFFQRGKWLNIFLSIVVLFFVYTIFRKEFSVLPSLAVVTILALKVIAFKAAYFQCEIVFYFLFFMSFLFIYKNLRYPSWLNSMCLGTLFALTYMCKASVQPAILIYLISSCLKLAIPCVQSKWKICRARSKTPLFALFSIFIFMALVSPYLLKSAEVFGSPFYNVNTRFVMWCDDWNEACDGPLRLGAMTKWPAESVEKLPGPFVFWQEHSLNHIFQRITSGFSILHRSCLNSYGYYPYVGIYLIACFFVLIYNFKKALRVFRSNLDLALFSLTFFTAYLVLFSWYTPIDSGNRFVLSLCLPFFYLCLKILGWVQSISAEKLNRPSLGFYLLHVAVLTMLAVDVFFVSSAQSFLMFGGS